jgi:hypothetical protein
LYDFLSYSFALVLGLELISCSFFANLCIFLLFWVLSGSCWDLWFGFDDSVSYWFGFLRDGGRSLRSLLGRLI